MTEQKTVRIWVYWNGSWAKIALRPGKVVNLYSRQSTDEGFDAREETYEIVNGSVYVHAFQFGRDCDGYLEHESRYVMRGTQKHSHDRPYPLPGMKRGITVSDVFDAPVWHEVGSSVYDETAQAMGY